MKSLFIFLTTISYSLRGQNLVNNSSFEILSSCPTSSNRQATLCVNWLNPTEAGTPDLYNTCLSGLVPSNGISYYQWPRTGNSFVGIWSYEKNSTNIREYLHSQLNSTLVSNNFYHVKFYAVLSNFSKYASNNLGLFFSNTTISQSGASNYLLNFSPQIKKLNNPIITDTLNWVEISGVYQAIGTENYITFGNFNNDNSTDTLLVNPNSSTTTSYYFIDDVSVTNITNPQWQYRDTSVVLGDSVLIGPAITGLNVDWYDMSNNFIKNAPGIYVKPTVNTSYKATETFNSAVYNHTVNVTVLPTAIKDYEKLQNSVSIFPNPSNGNFTLQFAHEKYGDVEISITNLTGKLVYENKQQITNAISHCEIDLKNGVYFIKITKKNKSVVKKLIVQQ